MKFELKTENENFSKSFKNVFRTIFSIALVIILCDFLLKIKIISRHYQINYNCRLLTVEKSSSNFKKLSRISNLKSKQKIWEFCNGIFK